MATDMVKLIAKVDTMLNGSARLEVDINDPLLADIIDDLQKARTRLELSQKNIAIDFPSGGSTTLIIRRISTGKVVASTPVMAEKKAKTPTATPTPKRHQHSYVVPAIAKDMKVIMEDCASHVVWLTGPSQCGKDKLVDYICRELGRRKFQINCHGRMSGVEIFGQKTIIVDPVTKQNIISFQAGQIEQFLKEGLDDQGNEVGEPGILFINEAAAMPAHVAIGMNRLLESDDPRRTFVIDADGGRVIRGHSGARIIFASNTVGRGATSMESSAYTAQTDALDISLLKRMSVCFQMGYDKEVEKHILVEKIGDDRVAAMIIKYRDAIRDMIRSGNLSTPFSTSDIVHIADMYRVFGDLGKAIYYVCFGFIMPEERAKYNETAVTVIGKDLLNEYTTKGVDYMV